MKDTQCDPRCGREFSKECYGFLQVTLQCPDHVWAWCTNNTRCKNTNVNDVPKTTIEASTYVYATAKQAPEKFLCEYCQKDMIPVRSNKIRRRRLFELERHLEVTKRAYNL